MLALSPSLENILCPSEEPIQQFYCLTDTETAAANYVSCNPPKLLEHHQSTSITTAYKSDDNPNTVKKLKRNAGERDRRNMMNNLYSSLRSLLPPSDQAKKLSIPATVSRVLEYIPELQQQVERLSQRKQHLLSKIYKTNQQTKSARKATDQVSLVSATMVTDSQIVVHISTNKYAAQTCPLSGILNLLEEEGLSLLNSSSFESFHGRIFYTLRFQVEGAYRMECEALSEKVASCVCI